MNKVTRIFLMVIALLVITDSYAGVDDDLDKIMNPKAPAAPKPKVKPKPKSPRHPQTKPDTSVTEKNYQNDNSMPVDDVADTTKVEPKLLTSEAACELVDKAIKTIINMSTWQSVMTRDDVTMEMRVINGQHYYHSSTFRFPNLTPWEKLDDDRKNTNFVVSQCKDEGNAIIDGVDVTVINYVMKNMGGESVTKSYIGKKDGLVYKSDIDTNAGVMTTRYSYKDVIVPQLTTQ